MREQPKLVRLDEVTAGAYRSRRGGFLQLRFGQRLVFVHLATENDLEHWQGQVGTYRWVQGGWRSGGPSSPDVEFREHRLFR